MILPDEVMGTVVDRAKRNEAMITVCLSMPARGVWRDQARECWIRTKRCIMRTYAAIGFAGAMALVLWSCTATSDREWVSTAPAGN